MKKDGTPDKRKTAYISCAVSLILFFLILFISIPTINMLNRDSTKEDVTSKNINNQEELSTSKTETSTEPEELSETEEQIKELWEDIEIIENYIDNNIYSTVTGKKELNRNYEKLGNLLVDKYINNVASLMVSYSDLGLLTDELIDTLISISSSTEKSIKDTVKKIKKSEYGSENYNKLRAELLKE